MLLQILFNEKFDEKFTQELINMVTEKEKENDQKSLQDNGIAVAYLDLFSCKR